MVAALLPMIKKVPDMNSFDRGGGNSPISKNSRMTALGFKKLQFKEEEGGSFSRDETPIGFSNRLKEIGPTPTIPSSRQILKSGINQFRIKYITAEKGNMQPSVMDKIRLTDIIKMESIIQKHDNLLMK